MTAREPMKPRVFVVDDDRHVLNAFSRLLSTAGHRVQTFDSSEAFLAEHDPSVPGCILLDVRMRNFDGFALQEYLQRVGASRPIIFVTGCDEVESSVRAMKAGAVDYLTKPVQEQALLSAVESAIKADFKKRQERMELAEYRKRLERLSPREHGVMQHVLRGRLNKQIAHDLGIVEKTVKVHRAHIMEKMEVRSVAALVHIAELLEGSESKT